MLSICGNSFKTVGKAFHVKLVERMPSVCKAVIKAMGGYLLDMIWKCAHLSISGPTVDSACQSKNQAMKSNELSVELRDRIVSRHRYI